MLVISFAFVLVANKLSRSHFTTFSHSFNYTSHLEHLEFPASWASAAVPVRRPVTPKTDMAQVWVCLWLHARLPARQQLPTHHATFALASPIAPTRTPTTPHNYISSSLSARFSFNSARSSYQLRHYSAALLSPAGSPAASGMRPLCLAQLEEIRGYVCSVLIVAEKARDRSVASVGKAALFMQLMGKLHGARARLIPKHARAQVLK